MANPDELQELLVNLPSVLIRSANAELIVNALLSLAPSERKLYKQTRKQVSEKFPSKPPASYVIWFIEYMLTSFKLTYRKPADQFLQVIAEFAKLGMPERKFLLRRKVILKLFDLYLKRGEFSPSPPPSQKPEQAKESVFAPRTIISGMSGPTRFGNMGEIIAAIVCSCRPPGEKVNNTPPPSLAGIEKPLTLSTEESEQLFNKVRIRSKRLTGVIFNSFTADNALQTPSR
jgi:hypothetical protein